MIILMEKRELPLVSVSIANRFGGAYEESKIKGIAHVIEHIVFTGTKSRSHEDISREIEKKGGILNAFTANEITNFYFKLPSKHLFAGLDILSDILNNPKFDRKKFEKEKRVILEEIKMYKDDPQKHVFEKIEGALFAKPFGDGVIGSEDTVSKLDRDFVYNYYKNAYNPSNYIAVIVGDADFEEVCDYFEKNFKGNGKSMKQLPIVKKNEEIVVEREGVDQANFVFAMHAPFVDDYKYYVLRVLDAYLADGMSSRLFLKIREEKGLAYIVKSDIVAEKNYSYYLIYTGSRKEAIPEIKEIILQEFKDVKNMEEKDLKEAKERIIGLMYIGRENSSGVMQELLYSELKGNAEDYYKIEGEINKVRLEDVKKLSSELIKEYSSAAILPK